MTKKRRRYTPQQVHIIRRKKAIEAAKKKSAPIFDYSKEFDFDSLGHMKGCYVDGKFEPD